MIPDINPTQEAQRPAIQGMGTSTLSPALRMLFFLSPKLSKAVSRRQGFSNNDVVFHKSNRCLLKCFHLVKKNNKKKAESLEIQTREMQLELQVFFSWILDMWLKKEVPNSDCLNNTHSYI